METRNPNGTKVGSAPDEVVRQATRLANILGDGRVTHVAGQRDKGRRGSKGNGDGKQLRRLYDVLACRCVARGKGQKRSAARRLHSKHHPWIPEPVSNADDNLEPPQCERMTPQCACSCVRLLCMTAAICRLHWQLVTDTLACAAESIATQEGSYRRCMSMAAALRRLHAESVNHPQHLARIFLRDRSHCKQQQQLERVHCACSHSSLLAVPGDVCASTIDKRSA